MLTNTTDSLNIVYVKDSDDPDEAVRLIVNLNADGVAASKQLLDKMSKVKLLFTGKRLLDGRLTLPYNGELSNKQNPLNMTIIKHYLEPSTVVKGQLTVLRYNEIAKRNEPVSQQQIDVRLTIKKDQDKSWLHITQGGPTGFESAQLTKRFVDESSLSGWCACVGCARYNRLYISPIEMRKAHEELKTNVYAKPTD